MGYNPVNDTVYMLGGNNSGTIKVFTIVPATGVQTRLADITNAASGLCFSGDTSGNNGYLQPDASMGFDSNGIAWIQSDGGDCYDEVIPWNPATGETWWSWDYYDTVGDLYSTNGEYRVGSFYIEGMAVVTDPAAPELPNTGINGAGIFGIGMLSVLVIGAGLVLARRRTA